MTKKAQPSLQSSDAFTCTPSDSNDIASDPGNVNAYGFVYLHNYGTSGVVLVTPADAPDLTSDHRVSVFIPQGGTDDMMIKKVWATGLGAGVTLTAKVGRGGSF